MIFNKRKWLISILLSKIKNYHITFYIFTFILFKACSNEQTDTLAKAQEPQNRVDPKQASSQHYICNDTTNFKTMIVGPDTLKLTLSGSDHIVTLERSASGAKYNGEGITFWNKGSESM